MCTEISMKKISVMSLIYVDFNILLYVCLSVCLSVSLLKINCDNPSVVDLGLIFIMAIFCSCFTKNIIFNKKKRRPSQIYV